MIKKLTKAIATLLMLTSFNLVYAEPLPLKIGMIIPLTGDAAFWAEAFKNAFELGASKLSAEDRARFEVLYEDDALNPAKTISALSKLQQFNGANFFVTMSSATSKAIAPLLEQQKKTLIAIASDAEIVRNRKYAFNFWVTPEAEAVVMIKALNHRKIKKIAIFTTEHTGTLAVRDTFLAAAKGQFEVIVNDNVPQDVKSFKEYISKLKSQQVDAILPLVFPGQMGIFTRQVRELGIQAPFIGFETLEDEQDVKTSNGAMLGAIFATAATVDKNFLTEYKSKYPAASLFSAANGYDLALLIGKALKTLSKDGQIDLVELNQYFATLKDFSGAMGTYSSTGDNRFSLPAVLKTVTATGFQDLSE